MSYRELHAQPQAEADFDEFLATLHRALTDGLRDPNEVVRDTLYEIYYGAGKPVEGSVRALDQSGLSLAHRPALVRSA